MLKIELIKNQFYQIYEKVDRLNKMLILVLMLYRKNNRNSISKNQSSQLIELIIAKQRNGPIGTVN
jgi:replicative DNA helicase